MRIENYPLPLVFVGYTIDTHLHVHLVSLTLGFLVEAMLYKT